MNRVAWIITMIVASVQLAYADAEKPKRFVPPAPVPQTGQTISIMAGDDGDLQAGVPLPNPRFTINNDGTVTDHLTGLVWLHNAGCSIDPALVTGNNMTWPTALSTSRLLADGQCGLTD